MIVAAFPSTLVELHVQHAILSPAPMGQMEHIIAVAEAYHAMFEYMELAA
jgi:hypothetical protein